MALDFPSSPTNGQVYGNFIWSSAKGAWQAKPITGKVTTSATAPSAPSNGDEWFNTNDGNIYVYYTDVDGSQWVQVSSDATLSSTLGNRVTALEAKPSGVVAIRPTSVTVSGGTATISGNGRVAFTAGTTGLTLNGVFSSAYRNYRVIATGFKAASAANDFLYYRLTASGTEASTNYYQASVAFAMSNGALQNLGGTGATAFMASRIYTSGAYFSCTGDLFNPFLASYTMYNGQGYGTTSGDDQQLVTSGLNFNNTSYDGLKILPTGASISGEISIYGYN